MAKTKAGKAGKAGRAGTRGALPPRPTTFASEFERHLIEGAEQALAIKEGRRAPARVDRVPVTARRATVAPPPTYTPTRVAAVRKRLKLSQAVFAELLNVSASTVRAWERAARLPDGPSLRLLEVADRHPEALLGALATRAAL